MVKELVHKIVTALVDHPEQISINEIQSVQSIVIELKVAKEDLGKVIGKQGRNAQALRTILGAASKKMQKHAVLEIIE
ncbi:MAG: KH domain-containing protein [Deltaproteobacteria bacterium]|nr:KH domain-containing protein [Deltaproteobacteria bacterium]